VDLFVGSILPLVDLDQIVGGHVLLVNPLVVGRRVALPSDQVLQSFSSPEVTLLEDLFDFPFFFSFDDVRRGFEEVLSVFHCFFIGVGNDAWKTSWICQVGGMFSL